MAKRPLRPPYPAFDKRRVLSPLGYTSGSTGLTDGSAFTFTGTGLGTRSVIAQVFDKCTGASVNTLWPNLDTDQGTDAFSYSSGFHSVAMPHPYASRYAIAQILNAKTGNAWLSQQPDWAGGNKFFYFSAYKRFDPNWPFNPSCDGVPSGDTDNNLKNLVVATGTGPFTDQDWYENMSPQKCALTEVLTVHAETTDGLGTIDTFGTDYGGVGAQAADPFYNWIKVEYLVWLHSSTGEVHLHINNVSKLAATGLNNDDQPGTSRTVSLGCYARSRDGANNYIYLADIVFLATTGSDVAKRVMLANNATLGSATIAEYCPVSSWSDTQILGTINKGNIPSGTAWLHAVNGLTTLATQQVTIV